jgi:actin-related protein|uniref:Actin n=1 Tax=Eutreptiella gymnastica TaxID=73025 RepID=A0A7S4CFY0_9EUGL|mmetsp:Transcript_53895/g.89709  ORF Transcript_53895/g.89709 Transcript_53895/m.89709 type:complete len:398 (+) Transcript_53895:55-1248(+)|eukprot:CAMPEP_0174302778 /NCGR_PEP_ID=MMETSP0809-20121228/59807_1 /TAXON_ID=73025 ORGANISM="Eutreptiella gymnastica-like, Strain CCMP1594" /NCGR_SAMPLE_ID=MMETSP0809 /ASSEMBLY_ACC=CAM_ASM_000658 /LENGTH=397 /DNA_ID=CAMNT_0015408707 /DNA_START=55 /DNA_END=1248 /DNA_ORIENTATION=+
MKMAVNTAKLLKNVPLPDEITTVHDNAVVIDTGGGTIKAGFSGDDCPRIIVPTCAGTQRGKHDSKETFVCTQATKRREDLDIIYPMEDGKKMGNFDWDALEKIWEHLYMDCLKVQPDDPNTPALLTEPALNAKENREKMCQIFFEKFKVPSLYVSVAPVLSVYASGRTTGIVVEAGNSTCHTVPIFEGFSLFHSILQLDFGGVDLTNYLKGVLANNGIKFRASHEREVCSFLKEKLCLVAQDHQLTQADKESTVKHVLPDGTEVVLGPERYTCCEALFNPHIYGTDVKAKRGLHATAIESIKKCDADITGLLYGNVVLSGGTSMFRGMQDRMLKEFVDLAPAEKIKVFASTERKYATWIGGSILASLPTFQDFWVTRSDYEDSGQPHAAHVVHRNCF